MSSRDTWHNLLSDISRSSVDERRARPYRRNSQRQVKTVEAVWTNGVPGHAGETHQDWSKL